MAVSFVFEPQMQCPLVILWTGAGLLFLLMHCSIAAIRCSWFFNYIVRIILFVKVLAITFWLAESRMHWLRTHMRNHIGNDRPVGPEKNILSFRRPLHSAENSKNTISGATALDLVCQAAEIIRNVDDHAAERQARAEALAKQAIEELKIAHARVRSAESKQQATEAALKDLIVKVHSLEKAMERAISHLAVADEQVAAAEQQTRTAERALKRIDAAFSIGI